MLARVIEVWDTTMLIRNDPPFPAGRRRVANLQRRLEAGANLEGRLRDDDRISNLHVVEIRDVAPELPTP